MKEKRNAIVLICIIGILLAASILFIVLNKAKSGKYAYIYQNNKLIQVIDLYDKEDGYRFTIEGNDGYYNTIEVRDGSIGIIDASCPDRLCKNMGFINNDSLPITCLPNHIVIEILDESGKDKEDVDGIAY